MRTNKIRGEVMKISIAQCVGLAAATAAMLLLSTITMAANLIVENGQLTGATSVDVDGQLYDVQFLDGFYTDTFTDASDLDATTEAQARLFGQALMDQVLLDTAEGLFDTDPELTFGCENTNECVVWIPFDIDVLLVTAVQAINKRPEAITIQDGVYGPNTNSYGNNFADDSNWVYADWSVVPVPAAVWLFGSGLLGLIGIARRKKTT